MISQAFEYCSTPTAAVIVSVESYEEAEREREILMRIARGEREVKSGKGHDLASVMADADKLLNPVKNRFTPSARTQFLEGLQYAALRWGD